MRRRVARRQHPQPTDQLFVASCLDRKASDDGGELPPPSLERAADAVQVVDGHARPLGCPMAQAGQRRRRGEELLFGAVVELLGHAVAQR